MSIQAQWAVLLVAVMYIFCVVVVGISITCKPRTTDIAIPCVLVATIAVVGIILWRMFG